MNEVGGTEYGQAEDYTPGFSSPAPSLNRTEIEEIVALCFADPVLFLKTFLPTKFPKQIPWFHRGLLAIVTGQVDFLLNYGELDKIVRHFTWKENPDDDKAPEHPIFKVHLDDEGVPYRVDMDRARFTEVIMPRGFSKTTLIGLGCTLYKILYREHKFFVYVSETARAAELQLGNVKFEIATNPLIKMCFGELVPARGAELKWTQDMIQTVTGVGVVARGREGQIRGLNLYGERPSLILFDDVEDKESVKTDDQRLKTKEWFYGDLIPALPEMDETATIIGLGTLLHRESLLKILSYDPEWTTIQFGAIDRDGEPLWADNMSLEKLERKKKSYALNGMIHIYYMEYESLLRSPENAIFAGPFILRPEWRGELDCIAQAMDPAISKAADADLCALAVAGITTKGFILALDMWMKRGALPNEQVDIFFEKSLEWDVVKHGVEAIAYQTALVHLIRGDMFRRKRYFVIEEIRHGRTRKDDRIRGILQPRYRNGYIAHRTRFPEYEAQLLDYPNGKKDGPDALAQAITLLDPFAANMADPEEPDHIEKDEYEPQKEWRQH